MLQDIATVIWKERKSLLRMKSRRFQLVMVLLSPLFLSIWLPWDTGLPWATGFASLMIALLVPLLLVGISIPDSFAGERERKTLETLLASRLPDRTILFGKLLACVALGWGATLLMLGVSLITLNLTHWPGYVLWYAPGVLWTDLSLSLLMALTVASLGVLISLRAPGVQEAQQILINVFLLPAMLFPLLLILFKEQTRPIMHWIGTHPSLFWSGGGVLLGMLSLILLWAAVGRFKRERLLD